MIRNAQEFGAAVAQAESRWGFTQHELALAINSGERFFVDLEAGSRIRPVRAALFVAVSRAHKRARVSELKDGYEPGNAV